MASIPWFERTDSAQLSYMYSIHQEGRSGKEGHTHYITFHQLDLNHLATFSYNNDGKIYPT